MVEWTEAGLCEKVLHLLLARGTNPQTAVLRLWPRRAEGARTIRRQLFRPLPAELSVLGPEIILFLKSFK